MTPPLFLLLAYIWFLEGISNRTSFLLQFHFLFIVSISIRFLFIQQRFTMVNLLTGNFKWQCVLFLVSYLFHSQQGHTRHSWICRHDVYDISNLAYLGESWLKLDQILISSGFSYTSLYENSQHKSWMRNFYWVVMRISSI